MNANSQKEVKKAKASQQSLDAADVDYTRNIMRTPLGRQWMWRRLERFGIFRSPFSFNALEMSYNTGKADLGRQWLDDLTSLCPDEFMAMMKEASDVRRNNLSAVTESGGPDAYSLPDDESESGDDPFFDDGREALRRVLRAEAGRDETD